MIFNVSKNEALRSGRFSLCVDVREPAVLWKSWRNAMVFRDLGKMRDLERSKALPSSLVTPARWSHPFPFRTRK